MNIAISLPAQDALIRLASAVLVTSVVFSALATAAARRFDDWRLFLLPLAVAAGMVGALALRIERVSPDSFSPLAVPLYMLTVFVVGPLVGATLFAARSVAARPERSFGAHAFRSWTGFMIGLLVGIALSAIPDLARAF
jgi:hypothetical protein